MRVEGVFDRDVDRPMKVQSINVCRIARERGGEEQFLAL